MRTDYLFSLISDGESFVKSSCPNLFAALKDAELTTMRNCADKKEDDILCEIEDTNTGFQDVVDIQDVSYNPTNKTLLARSVAGFTSRKGVIAIVSEVFDSITGESIKGSAVTISNAHSLECELNSIFSGKCIADDSRYFVRSVFYWSETDEEGKIVMKSREVRRSCGLIYKEGEEVVKDITVEFPNTLKPRDYTIVLYNRTAETHVDDPDKVYPHISPINNQLPFYLPFVGSVSVAKGKIVGINKENSVVKLEHPKYKTEVIFNKDKDNNWKDVKWRYLNNNTCLEWEFPENWKNNLDLKDLKVNSVFNFYARLSVNVDLIGNGDLEPISIPITIGFNVEQDPTHYKVKQVFLQWGCLGEQTLIAMADDGQKEINEIKVGDFVNTGSGSAEVIEVYCGEEKDVICIVTETNKRLLLTDGHPVLTESGWVRANDLNAAMCVITANGTAEKLKGLYVMPYGRKVYNLKLKGNNTHLIAEGIVVGDYLTQNQMDGSYYDTEEPIIGQENLASEFQMLVNEINKQNNWNN